MTVKELLNIVCESDKFHFAVYVDVWYIDTNVTARVHHQNLGTVYHYTVCEIHENPCGEIDAISIKR